MKIAFFDETTAGVRSEGPTVQFEFPKITVRTLIESRIQSEVDRRSQDIPIQKRIVNPVKKPLSIKVNFETQIKAACEAFDHGQLIVLLPGRQVQALDETLTLEDGDEVTFLRLVPLIGG